MIKYLKLKYLFIFYSIIRFTLHQLTGLIDSAGRSYSLILILCVLYYLRDHKIRKKIFKRPFLIWNIWIIYAIVNTLIQGMNFDMKLWQFIILITAPLILLYLTNIKNNIDFIKTLSIITIAAYVNVIIIFLFENLQFFKGEGYRLGETLNANELGINAFFSLFFLYVIFMYNKIKFSTFLILSILPIYIVLLSGSRSAFVSVVIIFISHFIIVRSKNIFKTGALVFAGVIIFILLFTYIGQKFIVIDRLRMSSTKTPDSYYTGTILDNLGSREAYFVFGSDIFLDNPLFGVGLGNYKFHNPISSQPNHVEIMIQLSELGIIGFSLFILFNYWIGSHLFYIWLNAREQRKYTEIFILGFICIFALSFTTWTYKQTLIFCLYGLTISYIYQIDEMIQLKRKRI